MPRWIITCPGAEGTGNSRNGYGRKVVRTETGRLDLAVLRDTQSSFDPQLIAKYQRHFPGFDEKIVYMYARGATARSSGICRSSMDHEARRRLLFEATSRARTGRFRCFRSTPSSLTRICRPRKARSSLRSRARMQSGAFRRARKRKPSRCKTRDNQLILQW